MFSGKTVRIHALQFDLQISKMCKTVKQRGADLCTGMGLCFGCKIVGMDDQLRVRLGMALGLRFQLLSLSRHLACRLVFCSTLTAMRGLPGGG